jgi:hypothetical protein
VFGVNKTPHPPLNSPPPPPPPAAAAAFPPSPPLCRRRQRGLGKAAGSLGESQWRQARADRARSAPPGSLIQGVLAWNPRRRVTSRMGTGDGDESRMIPGPDPPGRQIGDGDGDGPPIPGKSGMGSRDGPPKSIVRACLAADLPGGYQNEPMPSFSGCHHPRNLKEPPCGRHGDTRSSASGGCRHPWKSASPT